MNALVLVLSIAVLVLVIDRQCKICWVLDPDRALLRAWLFRLEHEYDGIYLWLDPKTEP